MFYKLFSIGPITVYSYGVMLALAFLIGIYLGARRARSEGVEPQRIVDFCIWVMIWSILGARLFYVLLRIDRYWSRPWEVFFLHKGGLIFYGGLIFVIPVSIWWLKRKSLPVFRVFDILMPSLAIGQTIGRIGCFLNGCCFGKISPYQWFAVQFPRVIEKDMVVGSPAFIAHCQNGLAVLADPASLPVYPTQIYSSLFALMLFVFVTVIYKRKLFDGEVFSVYLMAYSVGRFMLEFLRGDNYPLYLYLVESDFPLFRWLGTCQIFTGEHRILFMNLTISQNISIVLFAAGCILYVYRAVHYRNEITKLSSKTRVW